LGCGLPVLVSDLPSNQEWIKDAENGWLFKTGSVEDLKLKILDVYKNQNKLPIICKQARLTAEKKANWSENFKKLLEAYNSAVKS
jgi:glycosyltransferase involved in cell wall biosynthesis